MWAGLDFVCGELIGLWFAIGGSHLIDRFWREEMLQETFWFKIMKQMNLTQ